MPNTLQANQKRLPEWLFKSHLRLIRVRARLVATGYAESSSFRLKSRTYRSPATHGSQVPTQGKSSLPETRRNPEPSDGSSDPLLQGRFGTIIALAILYSLDILP